ncbi:MAG: hypothetical protein QF719_02590 [Chloroflexota bacterium]|nr:hypothetical protein [Chloroflexota bacterium]MDP6757090.1 hypothetical protein [Chloroflexota bacterium]
MDDHSRARELLPDRLARLIDQDVEGWVEQMGRTHTDCTTGPAGKVQEFRSVDGSIVIKWCDACEWHSVEERPPS